MIYDRESARNSLRDALVAYGVELLPFNERRLRGDDLRYSAEKIATALQNMIASLLEEMGGPYGAD
jgi:hypothetical protein